jgi:uncharacterized protein DUF6498
MTQPYVRVMALHIAKLGSPVPALMSLIVLKTMIDLGAHLTERRKLGPASGQALFATTSS